MFKEMKILKFICLVLVVCFLQGSTARSSEYIEREQDIPVMIKPLNALAFQSYIEEIEEPDVLLPINRNPQGVLVLGTVMHQPIVVAPVNQQLMAPIVVAPPRQALKAPIVVGRVRQPLKEPLVFGVVNQKFQTPIFVLPYRPARQVVIPKVEMALPVKRVVIPKVEMPLPVKRVVIPKHVIPQPVKRVFVSQPVKSVVIAQPVQRVVIPKPIKPVVIAQPIRRVAVPRPVKRIVIPQPVKRVVMKPIKQVVVPRPVKRLVPPQPVKRIVSQPIKRVVVPQPVNRIVPPQPVKRIVPQPIKRVILPKPVVPVRPVIQKKPIPLEPRLFMEVNSPQAVSYCDGIPVSVVVVNNGTGVARDIVLQCTLPPELQTSDGETVFIRPLKKLKPGDRQQYEFYLVAREPGKYSFDVTATADGNLHARGTVSTTVWAPLLQVEQVGPEKIIIGREVEYKIRVTNLGNGLANDTEILSTVLGNVSFVGASNIVKDSGDGYLLWHLGALAPQESRTVSFRVKALSGPSITAKAVAKGDCGPESSTKTETIVRGVSAILLEVIDLDDLVQVGDESCCVIKVVNQGTDEDKNIQIVATLEPQMELVSTKGPTKAIQDGNRVIFDPLLMLAAKAEVQWEIKIKAIAPGDVRTRVDLTSDHLSRAVTETEATTLY